jgi:hypothetical protein
VAVTVTESLEPLEVLEVVVVIVVVVLQLEELEQQIKAMQVDTEHTDLRHMAAVAVVELEQLVLAEQPL